MIPREHLGTARVPGGAELRLFRRGGDFMIVLERNELMNSRMRGSEEALAAMTIARLREPGAARLLVGGYGMGFTLRAALAALGPKARVTVAELVPEILEWARGPMAALTAGCLDDPRVRVVEADVAAAIGEVAASGDTYVPVPGTRSGDTYVPVPGTRTYMSPAWDAILLDVDNGPDGLVRAANDRLYSAAGLAAAKAALRPGGVLAIWSAAPDAAFARRLAQAGFAVEEVAVRARENGKGPRHVIWFARKR